LAFHFCADVAFDFADGVELLGGEDGECVAGGGCAAGAADSVDVVFGVLGNVVVYDVRFGCGRRG
jgi:hypothetical protein